MWSVVAECVSTVDNSTRIKSGIVVYSCIDPATTVTEAWSKTMSQVKQSGRHALGYVLQ